MNRPETSVEFLRALQKRPTMFFGTADRPFSSVLAFIAGVQIGPGLADRDFVPEGFHRFVIERFGGDPHGAKGWMTFVREYSKTEEEALDLFIRLREEFEARRNPNEPKA
jgi:hypothetical protein